MQENTFQEVIGKLTETIALLTKLVGKAPVMPSQNVANSGNTVLARRFIDNGDGTISDTTTRLMWQKEGSEKEMNFKDAQTYCKDSRLAGYDDWKLPEVEELRTLVNYTKLDPAIDPNFKCKSAYYWTSTPYAGGSDGAWMVLFYNGYVYWGYRGLSFYVRPVR